MPKHQGIIQFRFFCTVKQEENWIISSCPALDVHSQGKTDDEARKNLIEAISLFLETCLEMNSLDAVLKQIGYQPVQEIPDLMDSGEAEGCYLDIPLYLMGPGNAQNHAH